MSLGFLTESALVPSKATPIKVDAQSLVDLKAVVFQKDQERKKKRVRDGQAAEDGDSGRRLAKYAHLRGASRKKGGSMPLSREEERIGNRRVNRGVKNRSRRDEEAAELEGGGRDDDAAMASKSRAMLEKKAALYEQMLHGRGPPDVGASDFLVDFEAKRLASSQDTMAAAPPPDSVEIIDEFGRTRLVPRGSSEHLGSVQASGRHAIQEARGRGGDKDRDARDEAENASERGGGGSFVVSQWEHRLNASEKTYLRQVHERAEIAQAAVPSGGVGKLTKKQLRLEKLRQERAKAAAAKEAPAPVTTSSSSSPKDRLASESARVDDAAASAQAVEFLNEMSSMM